MAINWRWLAGVFGNCSSRPSGQAISGLRRTFRRGRSQAFEPLERRIVLNGDALGLDELLPLPVTQSDHCVAGSAAVLDPPAPLTALELESTFGAGVVSSSLAGSLPAVTLDRTSDPRTRDQQSGLPLLDSNPGAPVTIYLDFNGNFESDWWNIRNGSENHYRNVSTPPLDIDRNPAGFSGAEQAIIREIWARVSEDFAPFNINVSTDYYGAFNDGQALHVVFGGSKNDWLGENASGISSIGSFGNGAPNVVFVFDLVAAALAHSSDGVGHALDAAASTATTMSHEAGHAFGLRHHSLYRVDGALIDTYDPGNGSWAPIMGNSLVPFRATWDAGPTDQGASSYQADLEVLARPINVFGFRADDHGNTIATADALQATVALALTGQGIIGQMNDVDVFRFTHPGGALQATVNAAAFGPNLIPIAELWSASGFVARADDGGLTQSIIHANVAAGTYYLRVRGFGEYGDVGQYTVSVRLPQVIASGVASSGLTFSAASPVVASSAVAGSLPAQAASAGPPIGQPVVAAHDSPFDQNARRSIRPRTSTIAELHDAAFAIDVEEFGPGAWQGKRR